MPEKLRLGIFKFASCDGCQLSLLNAEEELLELAELVEFAHFPEASSRIESGPYDLVLIEGSISTPEDLDRIQQIRRQTDTLVTIGACATAGGIQALRNGANHDEFMKLVYPHPEYVQSLATSTPISNHVSVDFELRGCPVDTGQLLQIISDKLHHRKFSVPDHSVCRDCKLQNIVCVSVARGIPCLGPLTQAGCGAICPRFHRGCYGCFGPCHQTNTDGLTDWLIKDGHSSSQLIPLFLNVNAEAPEFARTAAQLIRQDSAEGESDE
ncbi:MAG TPA: oxidoreductase [Planctomycetaceae bacterium]|nr:oxidoreductase [Planctomycetaceae bacterium]